MQGWLQGKSVGQRGHLGTTGVSLKKNLEFTQLSFSFFTALWQFQVTKELQVPLQPVRLFASEEGKWNKPSNTGVAPHVSVLD